VELAVLCLLVFVSVRQVGRVHGEQCIHSRVEIERLEADGLTGVTTLVFIL
jgi:hypothetical protein